jgi:hypothetical protein
MQQDPQEQSWWRSPTGIVTLCLLSVAGFLLLTDHTAHIFGVLPYLLIAACPLMHLFMHHGHSHSRGSDREHEDQQMASTTHRARDRPSSEA